MRHRLRLFVFSLLLLGISPSAQGQAEAKVPQTRLDIHYHSGDSLLQIDAVLEPLSWHPGDTLSWRLLRGEVQSAHLLQGRIKSALAYRQNEETLQITMPSQPRPASRILVRYHYPLFSKKSAKTASPVLRDDQDWAIHWINWNSPEPLGWAGSFFPARKNSPTSLQINISVPASSSVNTAGELDFSVKQAESISYFYSTPEPIAAEDFYLAVGNWQAPDRDSREKLIEQQKERITSLRASRLREQLAPFIDYLLTKQAYALADEDLKSISERPYLGAHFPLQAPQGVDSSKFSRQQNLALLVARGDTARAAQWHYDYWRTKKGATWEAQLLDSLLRPDTLPQPSFWWERYLSRYLSSRNLAWRDSLKSPPDSIPLKTTDQAALSLVKVAYRERRRVPLNLSFRFQSSSEKLFIYSRGRALSSPARAPLELEIHTARQVLSRATLIPLEGKDTLSVPLAESPRSVYVHRGDYSPLHLEVQRPQAWYLYDLNRAPTSRQQRRALDYLLEHASPRLRNTMVGVALDHKDQGLKLKALKQIPRLSTENRSKWKKRVQELAQNSPHEKVRIQAREVLEKNYL